MSFECWAHHLGLEETDDGVWSIYFGTVLLAKVDERDMIIRDSPMRTSLHLPESVTHHPGLLCYPSSRLLSLPRRHLSTASSMIARGLARLAPSRLPD